MKKSFILSGKVLSLNGDLNQEKMTNVELNPQYYRIKVALYGSSKSGDRVALQNTSFVDGTNVFSFENSQFKWLLPPAKANKDKKQPLGQLQTQINRLFSSFFF
jgi:hypothetical protein